MKLSELRNIIKEELLKESNATLKLIKGGKKAHIETFNPEMAKQWIKRLNINSKVIDDKTLEIDVWDLAEYAVRNIF